MGKLKSMRESGSAIHVEWAATGKLAKLREALDAGSNVDEDNFLNISALGASCMNGHEKCARLLIEHGASLEKLSGHKGARPLALAAHFGSAKIVKLLVKAGADLEGRSAMGMTALSTAAAEGKSDVVAYLLLEGVDFEIIDSMGIGALFHAIRSGSVECAKLLVEAGANLMRRDSRGMVALHHAAMFCSALIPDILAKGCPLESVDDMGRTPLMMAVRVMALESAKELLDRGADWKAKSILGDMPMSLAKSYPAPHFKDLILARDRSRKESLAIARAAKSLKAPIRKASTRL